MTKNLNLRSKPKKEKKCKQCGKVLKNTRLTYCNFECQKKYKKAKSKVLILGQTRTVSYQTLKKKAWAQFSRFTRLRDANRAGICTCISCGSKKFWKEMQAGHFVAGRTNSILFHEELVRAQCYHCNIGLKGNYVEYFKSMRKLGYSEEQLFEFNKLTFKTTKITISEMVDIHDHYKQEADKLESKLARGEKSVV